MTRISLLICVVALASLVPAQARADAPAAYRGVVVDRATRAPIPGAVVAVDAPGDDAAATAMTDETGAFALAATADHGVTLVVSAPAYQTEKVRVDGGAVSAETLTLSLEPSGDAGEIIEITDTAPTEAEQAEPVTYEVTPNDIRRIAGSGNDALRALQSLPGLGRVPFGMGGLIVRGLGPRSTNVYLDGIEVPQLFHFGGVASFYPTPLLDDIRIEPGGFGVENGRALGGVVNLTSRLARSDKLRVSSELGLLDVAVRAEGPGPHGLAIMGGIRRSYIDQILPLFTSDEELGLTLAPRYYDMQFRIDFPRPRNETLSLVLFGADDQAGIEVDMDGFEQESFLYRARFMRMGLPWRKRDGDTAVSFVPFVGIERFAIDTDYQHVRRKGALFGARTQVERTFPHVDTRVGVEMRTLHSDLFSRTEDLSSFEELSKAEWSADAALWGEALVRLFDGAILAKPGLRMDHYGQTEEWVFDPRLNVSHLFPRDVTLRESLGVYHEPPVSADKLWGNDLKSSYAVQGTVGVDVAMPRSTSLAVTSFYTELYRLPADISSTPTNDFSNVNPWEGGAVSSSREFISDQFGTFSEQDNSGNGRAFGVETMIRHASPNALAWIAYTISRSERRDGRYYFAAQLPYILDQTHVLSLVGSWSRGPWFFGGRARFSTGNLITPVVDSYITSEGTTPIYGDPLSERLPAFFQIDLRVDREWKRPWGSVRAFLEVSNVFNRVNPEGVVYNAGFTDREYTRGLPILPAFGVEYVPAGGEHAVTGPIITE